MVALTPGKTVASKAPTLTIDAGLAVGTHVFTLAVVDNSGNVSAVTRLAVAVTQPGRVVVPPPVTLAPALPAKKQAARTPAKPQPPSKPQTKPRQK